jgi:NAD(P)-dependent dehydrogenase (short-subunit alcohol dehydrogenase family)
VSVALVTGAGRGIGLASARALAARGFAVALNGLTEADVAPACAALEAEGARVLPLPFDVTELAAHAPALDRLESALGPLSVLVNNAGVGVMARGDPLDVSEASWDRCLEVNAKAVFFLTQAVARRMIGRAGPRAIVTITSANAGAVAVPRSEYCASKAAAAMVTQAWAARLGAEGIAVYDVRPGLIATDMTAPVIAHYEERARDGLTLIPRVGQPEEVGEIVATLASGGLPYTTGQVVHADGGMLVPRF